MIGVFTTSNILYYLHTYGYVAMFILMFFEGPVTTYLAAFGASQGFFNIYAVTILAILGNILPDVVLFYMGKNGMKIAKLRKNKNIGFVKKLMSYVEEKPVRSIAIIKLLPVIPWPGFILTGTTKIPFKKFISVSALIGAFICLFFVVTGFYSGIAINILIHDLKLGSYALLIILVVGLVVWFVFDKLSKKFVREFEKRL